MSATATDWLRDAACREHDGRMWTHAEGPSNVTEEALTICAGCLVLAECAAAARAEGQTGVMQAGSWWEFGRPRRIDVRCRHRRAS